jgi:hypothetical protein
MQTKLRIRKMEKKYGDEDIKKDEKEKIKKIMIKNERY